MVAMTWASFGVAFDPPVVDAAPATDVDAPAAGFAVVDPPVAAEDATGVLVGELMVKFQENELPGKYNETMTRRVVDEDDGLCFSPRILRRRCLSLQAKSMIWRKRLEQKLEKRRKREGKEGAPKEAV